MPLALSAFLLGRQDAAPDLVEFDRLEQGLEIALAGTLVALALNDLEEDRSHHVLGEDLKQDSLAGLGRSVDQDPPLAHFRDIVAVARQALVDHVVIAVGRVLETDAVGAKRIDGRENIVSSQRDMLDPFTAIFAQELLDLALIVLALVERDPDLVVRGGHRAREQPGLRTFDVEVAYLAEVEDLFVELRPMIHPAAV